MVRYIENTPMKQLLILFACVITVFTYSACKKKNNIPVPTIDSEKADSVKQVPVYPYTDTFYGPYNVTSDAETPHSGFSTVFVQYVSMDSLIIYAVSVGIPRYDTALFPIYAPMHTNASNEYFFYAADDVHLGPDSYQCKITNDTLYCDLSQAPINGGNANYSGPYTGVLQNKPKR